jgi:hypothetical protein
VSTDGGRSRGKTTLWTVPKRMEGRGGRRGDTQRTDACNGGKPRSRSA